MKKNYTTAGFGIGFIFHSFFIFRMTLFKEPVKEIDGKQHS